MALKLSKADRKEFDNLAASCILADGILQKSVETYNATVADAYEKIKPDLEDMNSALEAVREFIEGRVDEWREDINGRSDAWQDGERGTAAAEFVDAWETAAGACDEIEIPEPDPIDIETHDFEGDFDLPDEPDYPA